MCGRGRRAKMVPVGVMRAVDVPKRAREVFLCAGRVRVASSWGVTDSTMVFVFPARAQIVCFNTAAVMGAMRFGFMPSVKKNYGGATSYKTMVDQEDAKSIGSKDPAGFTAVDVLAAGSFATIISAGEILARQVPY